MNQPKKNNKKKTTTTESKNNKNGNDKSSNGIRQDLLLHEKINVLTESNRLLKRKIFDLYTIFEINRNFSAVLDYQQLLDTFLFTSLAQVSSSKASIYLQEKRESGNYKLSKHRGSGVFPNDALSFEPDSDLIKYLEKMNRPGRVEELIAIISSEEEKNILKNFVPGLVVPLIYQSHLSGLLLVSDKISDREFNDDDMEFLSILGNQISVAIENTRLYEAEKTATRQLRETQQQLIHSERLAALGEMSAKVAHEINNPLGIIKNYLLLAQKEVKEESEAKKFCSIVSQEIDRIAKIVRELLDFHRPKGFEVQKVNLAVILSDILLLTERKLEATEIQLTKMFDPKCPDIMVSPENMKQVFLNLILNAIEAMKDGGSLIVSLNCQDDFINISFCDTGPGIPYELIPRVFEPFFSTKTDSQGTGLGLSVCYGIIKRHNGSITYKNQEIGGCFEIKLPINDPDRKYDHNI